MKIGEKIHFDDPRKRDSYTSCGKFINGYTVRHTSTIAQVTCKRCLQSLKHICQCNSCGTLFVKD